MAHLVVIEGRNRGAVYPLEYGETLRLGRDREAELRVPDAQISRFHAAVGWKDDEGFELIDLGSRNGTYLNGARLERAAIKNGDEITIGGTRLVFACDADELAAGLTQQATRAAERTSVSSAEDGEPKLIGGSPALLEVQRMVLKAARAPATVLITGESGTGKELAAGAIHHHSPRRDGPLVILNCSTLHGDLLNSELFGHEKGAFTGAAAQHAGAFERADGGTLFLDEVGELPLETQATLLRVVEGKGFTRLGGTARIKPDVRLIAATHRDLRAAVGEGRFREDLFFRFAVLEVRLPALRERGDDVALLANHFLARAARKLQAIPQRFSPEALAVLTAYRWPGNVRELRNVVERVAILGEQPVATPDDLPPELRAAPSQPAPAAADDAGSGSFPSLQDVERHHIERALKLTTGNKSRAARLLGIDRMTLYNRLKRYEGED